MTGMGISSAKVEILSRVFRVIVLKLFLLVLLYDLQIRAVYPIRPHQRERNRHLLLQLQSLVGYVQDRIRRGEFDDANIPRSRYALPVHPLHYRAWGVVLDLHHVARLKFYLHRYGRSFPIHPVTRDQILESSSPITEW